MKLYELADELQILAEQLIESGGELTCDLEAALNGYTEAFELKARNIALLCKNIDAEADIAEHEASRLASIVRARRNSVQRLKDYLKVSLEKAALTRLDDPLVKIWIQRNGRPSIAWVRPVEVLPERYRKVVPITPDLDRAYKDLNDGLALPEGFKIELGSHLRIR